ncbi:MAG: hypothetical protein VKO39_03920 [Cyanobacteriota bacterium]|nr:hypothetical protein [Cyanobacteriota bacterium]
MHIHHKGACLFGLAMGICCLQPLLASAQTSAQKQALRDCGVALVLPADLPAGFKLDRFTLNQCPGGASKALTPSIQDPGQCKISVNGSNGGWGAPGALRSWQVNTKLFGAVTLEEYEGSAGRPNVLLAFATNVPDFKSFPNTRYIFSFECKSNLSDINQTKKVISSARQIP